MATDTDVKYETRTVQAVRGIESRTIQKWQSMGWEYVSQTTGRVKVEITFRRPKPKSRLPLFIGVGAVLVVVLAVGAIVEATRGKSAAEEAATPAATATAVTPRSTSPSAAASSAPTSSASVSDGAVLTRQNSPDLAAVLTLTDTCSPRIADFATKYKGRTIRFPASIWAMARHGNTKTRYDILVNVGDFGDKTGPGPDFQFRDVNTVGDLRYVGPVPDTVGVGANLTVTAEIDRFEARSCLFLIDPVSTAFR